MTKDTKVKTGASRLREISNSVHDEDRYKEYIDWLYADVYCYLERLAKTGATYAEISKKYFQDKLKTINPIADGFMINEVTSKVLTKLSDDGFIVRSVFMEYSIQW